VTATVFTGFQISLIASNGKFAARAFRKIFDVIFRPVGGFGHVLA
jgi:hypothetical protein